MMAESASASADEEDEEDKCIVSHESKAGFYTKPSRPGLHDIDRTSRS